MTLKELMAADVSGVFLNTDDFAESITHWPANVEDDAVSRTVVFIEDSPVTVKKDGGKAFYRNATIRIESDVTITKKDAWFRNGERWETEVEGRDVGGMKQVQVVRVERVKSRNKKDKPGEGLW